tara:strand:- start:365 stop:526 length:162 start_codon:yes stop_codon:yes gene_type:complete
MNDKKETSDEKIENNLPSAAEDCADIKSNYDKFIKDLNKPKFPPVDYEKPPHF